MMFKYHVEIHIFGKDRDILALQHKSEQKIATASSNVHKSLLYGELVLTTVAAVSPVDSAVPP